MEESMIGKKVKYCDETWEVVHVTEERRAVIVRIAVNEKMAVVRVDPRVVMVDLDEIEEIPHEMTAKEYAEKLKAVFGNETTYSFARACICRDMPCRACPLNAAYRQKVGFDKDCSTLILYHPDLAAKMMEKWQDKRDKPKRKTYLEDFREKMTNAYIDPNFGTPLACRKRMYYHEIDDLKCGRKDECTKCWNEEMPEVSDNAEG